MATYFISDLHLNPDAPLITAGFVAFIGRLDANQDKLYILGDFFDAWIGDDEDHPYYTDIIATIHGHTQRGLKVFFMHGNRDFLIGQRFAELSGAQLISEPHQIELAGKRISLQHGDNLCSTDTEYMAFREQVRNPVWQQQILSLPLEQRRAMAAQLRAQSTSMNSNKAEDIMDVNPVDVSALLADDNIDILLHGHTHRPARHTVDDKERIVLGDWGETGWYVKADDNSLELVEFTLSA